MRNQHQNAWAAAFAAVLVTMMAPPVSADGRDDLLPLGDLPLPHEYQDLMTAADSIATEADNAIPDPWFAAPDPLVVVGSGIRQHLALVTIPSQGAQPVVNLPVPETLLFNLAIQLPYQNGTTPGDTPSAIVSTVNEIGQIKQYTGYVNLHDDPSGERTDGKVELFFSDVDYVRTSPYTLTMSWEPGVVYTFQPTDVTGFHLDITEYGVVAYSLADELICGSPEGCPASSQATVAPKIPVVIRGCIDASCAPYSPSPPPPPDGGGGGGGGGGGCTGQTYVGHSIQNAYGFADTNLNQGNEWKTYASADFDAPTTWYGGCNKSGPGSYGAGNGYGATIRGPNNPALYGSHLMDWSTAYKGGGTGYGSSDNFGWKDIKAKPQLTLGKPTEGRITLESTSVLGLNKNSCTAWPQSVKEALDVLSLFVQNSYASVVLYFATRDYCSNDKPWTSLDSGTSNDRSRLGARIDKASTNAQYEYGGRFTFKAVATGEFRMPFTYQENVYGTVTAEGNPSTSFNYWSPGLTTGSQPRAQVV